MGGDVAQRAHLAHRCELLLRRLLCSRSGGCRRLRCHRSLRLRIRLLRLGLLRNRLRRIGFRRIGFGRHRANRRAAGRRQLRGMACEAFQRFAAAGLDTHAMRDEIASAGAADRLDLGGRRLRGERMSRHEGAEQGEQCDAKTDTNRHQCPHALPPKSAAPAACRPIAPRAARVTPPSAGQDSPQSKPACGSRPPWNSRSPAGRRPMRRVTSWRCRFLLLYDARSGAATRE